MNSLTDEQLMERLQQGQTYHLPSKPNWFYLGENKGQERLYIVASTQPIPHLGDLYTQHHQADDGPSKQETLSSLLKELETVEEAHSEKAVGWVFTFEHR